jgi:hypothetical protein
VIEKILPPRIDNTYRGHKLALWLFGLVLFVRITQSVVVIVSGNSVARSADGIPLETFGPAAAQTAVALFGLSALNRLFILLLGVLTLVRYRSAVSLMFVVLMLNYLAGQLLLQFVPLVRTGTPPGPLMNLALFGLMVIGLPLSLWHRDEG